MNSIPTFLPLTWSNLKRPTMQKRIYLQACVFLLGILLVACDPDSMDCSNHSDPSACNETPPTDETCEAWFTRWFYDKSTGSCTEIGYSGCTMKGFESKDACEACKRGNALPGDE